MGDHTMSSPGQEPDIKKESRDNTPNRPTPVGELINLISDDEDVDATASNRLPLSPIKFRGRQGQQEEVNLGSSLLQKAAPKDQAATGPSGPIDMRATLAEKIRAKQRQSARQMRDPEIKEQTPALSNGRTSGLAAKGKSSLFVTDSDSGGNDDLPVPPIEDKARKRKTAANSRTKKRRKSVNYVDDDQDVMEQPLEEPEEEPETTTKKRKSKAGAKKKGKYTGPTMLNAEGINTVNVVEDAAHNDSLANPPTFGNQSTRNTALYRLIESIPLEKQDIAKADIKFFNDKLKAFTGKGRSISSAPNGDWNVKGMRVTLKPYQMLGVASMRERETSGILPRGGILADQMGLGKTIMMLTNIMNGRPLHKKNRQTTLIVASPALITQWHQEIKEKVTHKRNDKIHGLGAVHKYTSVGDVDDVELFKNVEIVLTTYNAVSKSYPSVEIPQELTTATEKEEWWSKYYKKNRGPLHRMAWHRVILDEAQAIKNHKSLTSRAVRALETDHPWSVSGTIVTNTTLEFYPQFRFLKVPFTDSYKLFKENYAKSDPDGIEKLTARSSLFMIRRTHRDTLFSSKLLVLPTPSQETLWLEFNDIERSIYDIVKNRFIERINCMSKANELDKQYNMIWSMLLRLRQLSAHILLAQDTIADLIGRDDYERLRAMSADDLSDESEALLGYLQQHMANGIGVKNRPSTDDNTVLTESEVAPIDQATFDQAHGDLGGSHGLTFHFSRYLDELMNSESFAKCVERTKCVACRQPPDNPLVTSCYHIYCRQCLEDFQSSSARRGNDRHRCTECGAYYTDAKPCEEILQPFAASHEASSSLQAGAGSRSKSKEAKKADTNRWWSLKGEILPSAKTVAFKARVMTWLAEDPDVKIVVYSQFLPMVHILWRICQTERWEAERYTGAMSHESRQRALQRFANKDGNVRILLASLKAGGIGLNLTSANKVITFDPWWNASIEQQAFCRVYRIGQEKETQMTRLVVKNTIDEAIMALQESKQVDIDAAMDESRRKEKISPAELLRLFGKVTKDETGRPFVFAHRDGDEEERNVRPQPAPEHSSDEESDGIVDDY